MLTQKTQVSLKDFYRAKRSVNGRLARLRNIPTRWAHCDSDGPEKSPIEKIGVFGDEIDLMEKILENMQERIENAKITIEI